MAEIKTKKNTDYSASAVNLCNPPEVKELLERLQVKQVSLQAITEKIEACVPAELREGASSLNNDIGELKMLLQQCVDRQGSYQDIERGEYAVKQRRVSKNYNVEPFEKTYPQFAPAVIVKAIDTSKLNGLIKGGLLDEARLEADGVLVCTSSFAYIIKV